MVLPLFMQGGGYTAQRARLHIIVQTSHRLLPKTCRP
jgi:hypothetical protein